ncbi:MAG TPA: hypothetical protein VFZ32_03695 [Micromonosporaceae bacterium]
MNRLETELREMFAAKTREVPAMSDPMHIVLPRARRIRRRYRTGLASAIAVVVILTLLAGFRIGGHFRSTPPVSPNPPHDSVEMIVNDELVRPDGTRIPLRGRQVTWAARVPAGLLFVDSDQRLLEMREDRLIHGILPGEQQSPVPSRNGWRVVTTDRRGTLFHGTLSATAGTARHGAVGRHRAAQIVGWYGQHVVLRDVTDTGMRYALVDLSHPDAELGWAADGQMVLLGESRRRFYWGLKPSADAGQCLVRVAPERRFEVVEEACDLGLPADVAIPGTIEWPSELSGHQVALSPDGRYLAVEDGRLRVLDLDTAFSEPRWIAGCPASETFTWVARDTLVSGNTACRVEPSGRVTSESLPPQPAGARVLYVTSYGL